MRDSQGVEKLQELVEIGVLDLIKGAFKKKGIPRASEKKEIAVGHGLVKHGIKLLSVPFKEVMSAGVKACGIKGPHEGSDEINDFVGQGILL